MKQHSGDVRVVAVRVLATLLDGGGSLSRLLPAAAESVPAADRALLQSLCFDMARWLPRLEGLLAPLLDKSLRRKDDDVRLLLLLGLLQLTERRMAAHAAVDTAVKAAGKLRKPWARGLVNGVLRNFQRREQALIDGLNAAEARAFPAWMIEQFRHDWPERWEQIADACNRQAPMVLRVNSRQGSVEDWLARAAAAGIDAKALAGLQGGVQLAQPQPVDALPGFADGAVSVQDGAAQHAAQILQAWPGRPAGGGRLLDACAAPGGKTAHALELAGEHEPWAEVVALDQDAVRLARVQQTLERLALTQRASLQACDAAATDSWWDSQLFDAILLDAPCSGTGVIRRHPDIKLLRRRDDIDVLAAGQARLLDALWPAVAPGGCLLYATCSILKVENELQVASFMARHADAVLHDPATLLPMEQPASAGWGERRSTGRQIFPDTDGMDGFFYALIGKLH